uniref:Uncharacterized protein n=1 Tax=Parascaris univalens TaxID=6257 RepID=A0A915AGM5_PARUN
MEMWEIIDSNEKMNATSGNGRSVNRQDNIDERSSIVSLTDIRDEFAKIPNQMEIYRMGDGDLRRWVGKLLKLNKAISYAFNNGEAKLKTLRAVLDEESRRIRECDRQLREHGLAAASEVVFPHQTLAEASCPLLENNFSSLTIAPKLRPSEGGGINESRDVTTSVVPISGLQGHSPRQSFAIPPPVLSIPPPHCSVPPPNFSIPPPLLDARTPHIAVPFPNFPTPPPRIAIPPAGMNVRPLAQSAPNASSPQWWSNFK